MKGKLIAVFLCLALLLTGAAAARAGENQQNVIQVSGEGIVDVAPDQAELMLAVITEAADARQAQAENAEKSARVIKALKAKGIPEADIRTQNYHLSPKYSQIKEPEIGPLVKAVKEERKIVGYTVHHQIRVKVKDLDNVGELMDLAVKNGANQISNVSFLVSDSLVFKKKALRAAVEDARAKAEVLAAALGKTITGVQSASGSWHETNTGPVYYKEMAYGAGDRAGAPPVTPGMVQIRGHASITFLIK